MRRKNSASFITVVSMGLVFLISLVPVGAASANISHSYRSRVVIKSGSLVSLDQSETSYVIPANSDNDEQLLGVAVGKDDSLLAVDPTEGQVQVTASGTANVLVSTLNGDIGVGDSIAASPFNGVGVKAESGSRIVGLAQTAFNKDTEGASREEVKDKNGKTNTIYVGFVKATVSAGTLENGNTKTSALQRLGRSLTGHTVSTVRILIALVIAVVSVAALIILAYAAIYGTIVSIGRNPLAKYAIFKTLGTVLGMVAVIALISGVTIYLLLT